MTKETKRLTMWMATNGHTSASLSQALGYKRDMIKQIIQGRKEISAKFIAVFIHALGEALGIEIFGAAASYLPNRLPRDVYMAHRAAHRALTNAIKDGRLAPARSFKCHACNKPASGFHHASYHADDNLCVVPLCRSCHVRHHRSGLAITFGVVPTLVGTVRIAIASHS